MRDLDDTFISFQFSIRTFGLGTKQICGLAESIPKNSHNEDEVYGAKKFCLVVSYSQSIFISYLCIWMQKNLIFDPKMIQKQQAKKSTRGAFWQKSLIYYIKSELSNE